MKIFWQLADISHICRINVPSSFWEMQRVFQNQYQKGYYTSLRIRNLKLQKKDTGFRARACVTIDVCV